MINKEDRYCENCRWWHDPRSFSIVMGGECHRYPPTFVPLVDPSWPTTKNDDWCGEWTEKLEEE